MDLEGFFVAPNEESYDGSMDGAEKEPVERVPHLNLEKRITNLMFFFLSDFAKARPVRLVRVELGGGEAG